MYYYFNEYQTKSTVFRHQMSKQVINSNAVTLFETQVLCRPMYPNI